MICPAPELTPIALKYTYTSISRTFARLLDFLSQEIQLVPNRL